MVDGETTGGLNAKPGRAPAATASFSELEAAPAVESWTVMWPTETRRGESSAWVLNMIWAGLIAARRVGGQVLSVVWASRNAARRFGGRVLDMAWAGGSAAIRFGGWVLGVTLASVSAARRFGGRDLDMASGDVHAWPVTTEVRALPVYVRVVRSVGGGVRGVGVGAVPL